MHQLRFHGGPNGKLCFGYFDYDGVVMPQPPVRRAVKIVVDKLRAAGHTGEHFQKLQFPTD